MRYLICLLNLICLSIHSQSLAIQRANKHYSNLEYKDAAEYYESALKKDANNESATRNLAYCYLKLNNMPMAEYWFNKVVKSTVTTPDDILNYAETLEENNKYAEAKIWFEKYNKMVGSDKRGKNYLETLSHLNNYYSDSANYKVRPVSFLNTSAAEFSPCFYNNGLLYVTERNKDKFSTSSFMWDKSHFLDLYFSEIDSSGNVIEGKSDQFSNKLNTKYHEGPVALNKEQNFIVFTRNNYFHHKVTLSKDGVNKLMLFYSQFKDGKWQSPENFPFNNNNYSCGHPALNCTGKIMFFASDMPGSIGGTDIWFSKFENGIWTEPINAGKNINTEGNELFPTIVNDSIFYYASNGLGGLGGLDIFSTAFNNGNLGSPKNMGYPINSTHDDFSLIYNPQSETGYFSSGRENKNGGNDDIYLNLPGIGLQL